RQEDGWSCWLNGHDRITPEHVNLKEQSCAVASLQSWWLRHLRFLLRQPSGRDALLLRARSGTQTPSRRRSIRRWPPSLACSSSRVTPSLGWREKRKSGRLPATCSRSLARALRASPISFPPFKAC